MKKLLTVLLVSAMMMAVPITCAFAADAAPEPLLQIGSVSGTVTGITDFYDDFNMSVDGKKFVHIAHGYSDISSLVVSADTYFITGDSLSSLKIGDTITSFYDATLPMFTLNPPQYQPIAVAVNPPANNYFIKVDKFDNDLLSWDKQLKINTSKETAIMTKSNSAYNGSLSGLTLAVIYSASTKSIPALTTPSKIIVLEKFLPAKGNIIVMGTQLSTRDYFIAHQVDQQIVMVPFRAVAEKLGFVVSHSGGTVFLDAYQAFKYSIDGYNYDRRGPQGLGTAPHVHDFVTYVPLSYFDQVLNMNNAYYTEGRIVIDNNEPLK